MAAASALDRRDVERSGQDLDTALGDNGPGEGYNSVYIVIICCY